MAKAVEKFHTKNAELHSNAKRPKGAEQYDAFLSMTPFPPTFMPAASPSTANPASVSGNLVEDSQLPSPPPPWSDSGFSAKLAEKAVQLAAARRKEEDQASIISDLKFKLKAVCEVSKDSFNQLKSEKTENGEFTKTNEHLEVSIKEMEKQVAEKKQLWLIFSIP